MALRGSKEKGTRRSARRRVGTDFQSFGGMDLESDPGAIAKNEFRHLENVDFRDQIQTRGGQELVNEEEFEGCQQFLSDFQPTAHRIYFTFIGKQTGGAEGRSISFFDPDYSGLLQPYFYYPWAEDSEVLGIYGSNLFASLDSYLKKLQLRQPIVGQSPLEDSGKTPDTVVASLAGFVIRAMAEFDGFLFLGCENVANPTSGASIFTWDGTTLRLDLAGTDTPTRMIPFRDVLAIGYDVTVDKLRLRTTAGVYSTVAHTGVIATLDMVSHKDLLYIVGGTEDIWKYDGTTLAIWHTIADAEINSLESYNNFLWYAYQSVSSEGILGRWSELSVFQDEYKNFTDQDPAVDNAYIVRAYRQQLYVVTKPSNITSALVF